MQTNEKTTEHTSELTKAVSEAENQFFNIPTELAESLVRKWDIIEGDLNDIWKYNELEPLGIDGRRIGNFNKRMVELREYLSSEKKPPTDSIEGEAGSVVRKDRITGGLTPLTLTGLVSAQLDKELSDMEILWGILGRLDLKTRSRMLDWVEQRITDLEGDNKNG